jgi:AcrR family transcriptional regulator
MVSASHVAESVAQLPGRRGRGRPRLAETDSRLLEAALDLLDESGVAGFTFDGVAARTGIAKTTIYRRWPNKVDLMVDAIGLERSRSPVPSTGDVHGDLEAGLDNMLRAFTGRHARAIAAVYGERIRNEEIARAWDEKLAAPHMLAFEEILRRGVASGELREDLEVEEAAGLVAAPAMVVLLGSLGYRPSLAGDVVDMVLHGIRSNANR